MPPKPPPRDFGISAEFPFESKFVTVHGSRMHYVDVGEGKPILFLHGNPTSSYLWRNIIPHLVPQGRAIAPDLIGMGKSAKPDIDYLYEDHLKYIEGFIEALDLHDITLVIHDWGSVLGLDYASRHRDNVIGVAFMEALVAPSLPRSEPPPEGSIFARLRDPEIGPKMVIEENFFVEKMLPFAIARTLSEAEMDAYRAPFPDPASRKPVYVWPNEVPFGDGPARTRAVVERNNAWMLETNMPFLLLYANPGRIISPAFAQWMAERLKNIETHYVGVGYHFIQEDHPHEIGLAVADWRRRLVR